MRSDGKYTVGKAEQLLDALRGKEGWQDIGCSTAMRLRKGLNFPEGLSILLYEL